MSSYSHITHKSDLLCYDKQHSWLSPELIKAKANLNGILNRIIQSIQLINFILEERDKQVNAYRKKSPSEKLGNIFWYLVLFTESYFTYAKNILNAYAELIYEVMDNLPKKTNGDFSELWGYLKNNNISDKELQDYFRDKMRWYEILILLPRNQLVIHDKKTSGYGMSDHEIDVYIGKHATHDTNKNKKAIALVQKIISNHQEFNGLNHETYFHPIYRQIVAQIDILDQKEINTLVSAAGIVGFDFPYIPQTTPKLQDFIDFIEKRLTNKFQMCPNCKQPTLRITCLAINPTILKFDPNNIWFGWTCSNCTYQKKFIL